MIGLNRISLEQKSAALFGSAALLLSMSIGFISGIRWNVVVLRSAVMTAVFAAIGFGMCVIVKKFVPEFYEALVALLSFRRGARGDAEPDAAEGGAVDATRDSGPDMDETMPDPVAGEFKELDKEDLAGYTTIPRGGGTVNTSAGKLGKHILEKEKLAKYEPKVMAQAVRTMMSRERE